MVGVYLTGSGQHVKQIMKDPHQGLKTILAGLKVSLLTRNVPDS
jgi:hypothetical protein